MFDYLNMSMSSYLKNFMSDLQNFVFIIETVHNINHYINIVSAKKMN